MVEFDFSLTEITPASKLQLANTWQQLEQQIANDNYFVCWDWIDTWLKQVSSSCYLLTIVNKQNSDVVGLAIWCLHTNSLGKTTFYLHKTGIQAFDQIWIEYNQPLISAGYLTSVVPAMLQYLFNQSIVKLDAIVWDMTVITSELFPNGVKVFNRVSDFGYCKSLQQITDFASLLKTFSKNCRQQINRSRKLLEQQSRLTLSVLTTAQQKLKAFPEIAKLHRQQWHNSEWGSGFDNDKFVHFHQQLMRKNNTLVIALKADDKAIAYGYYLLTKTKVYFYLSAIEKHTDKRIKVGLLFHSLAMVEFAKLGYKNYDFLAGNARYKKSLSDKQYQLFSHLILNNSFYGTVEQILRSFKEQ